MVLKLYGSSTATCTRRVATILHEKHVPFELHNVDIKSGENKSAEHRQFQPFGQIPYINDDGFILYESRAICRYICEMYPDQGPTLIPTEVRAKALFEQAFSVEGSHFDPPAFGAVLEAIFKPFLGGTTDKAALDAHLDTLDKKLEVYEVILSKQKYFAGNQVTLADLFHLPYGAMIGVIGSDVIQSKPHVARWFADISSRESWLTVKDVVQSTA